jgi:branched-subunit amino acid ABC-type transport system permease component
MLGAFITYSIWKHLFIPVVGFYIATILASLVMAGVGLFIEFFLLRRLYSRGWPEQLLATYAIILIITDVVKWGWGGEFLSIPRPKPFTGAVFLFGFPFPSYNFFVILLGLALVVFLWWLVYRTRLGDIIRAAASDREMVAALGIPIPWLFTWIFVLGSLIAGMSGAVSAPYGAIRLGMDIEIIVECFAVVVIGGMGASQDTPWSFIVDRSIPLESCINQNWHWLSSLLLWRSSSSFVHGEFLEDRKGRADAKIRSTKFEIRNNHQI